MSGIIGQPSPIVFVFKYVHDWADGSILLSTAKAGEEDEGGFDEAGAWVSWIAFEEVSEKLCFVVRMI